MPGGDEESIRRMLPLLEKIAAQDFNGNPCVTYVGQEAAGNFVKMVHNGIEYALMQWIAEIYNILNNSRKSQEEIQTIFQELNSWLLKSFLMDITVDILGTKDYDGGFLLPKISSKAGSKGTGSWTVEAALKFGVPVPTIAESLFARWISAKEEQIHFPKIEVTRIEIPTVEELRQALEITYFASYIQWIELILAAEKSWNWWINLTEVLRIWQGGCIIRSEMLRVLPDFYKPQTDPVNSTDIAALLWEAKKVLEKWFATPVLSSAYNYLSTLQSEHLPTNLIQAMRDSFGAHGVKRIGSDVSESFSWK